MAYDKVVDSAALDAVFADIGNAIRTKSGTSDEIGHTDMANAILAIPAVEKNIWEKYGKLKETQQSKVTLATTKTDSSAITPASVTIDFHADIGFDIYGRPIPNGNKMTLTPSTDTIGRDVVIYDESMVPNGYYFRYGDYTYITSADTKFYTEYQYSGYYNQLIVSNVVCLTGDASFVEYVTSDNEEAYQDGCILDGYYYKKIPRLSPELDLVPQNIRKGIDILGVTGAFEGGEDADLIPENIREGVEILGVLGTMTAGVSGIDYGQVTLSGSSYSVKHSLGKVPKHVILIKISTPFFNSYYTVLNINNYCVYSAGSSYGYCYTKSINKTATNITFQAYSSSYPYNGTYLWIAVA